MFHTDFSHNGFMKMIEERGVFINWLMLFYWSANRINENFRIKLVQMKFAGKRSSGLRKFLDSKRFEFRFLSIFGTNAWKFDYSIIELKFFFSKRSQNSSHPHLWDGRRCNNTNYDFNTESLMFIYRFYKYFGIFCIFNDKKCVWKILKHSWCP